MSTPLSCARRIKAASDALVTPQPSVYINAIVVLFLSDRTEPARAAADAVRRQYVLFSSNLRFPRRQRGKVRMVAEESAAARGLCAAARFGASRGGPRRFRGEAKRPLKMMESCGHCVAGCRVQNTPRFPVGRRGKPERPPYAAALTLFSGVRNSDVSARQAGGGTRIAAVHTLILYAVVSRCTESRNFSRRRRGKFE